MNSKIIVKHPVAIQWKITGHRLHEERNGYLKSDTFNIPDTDVQYFFIIFPNSNGSGKTRIYFYLKSKEQKDVETEITISIVTANSTQKLNKRPHCMNSWECSPCTIDELFDPGKRFIVNGEMVIKVDGFLMIEKDAPENLCKLGNTENSLGYDLWNQDIKDFTIVVDEKEILAHKFVLSFRSPVFDAMFKPHTKEAQENRVKILDFSFDVVETAIKLCYDPKLVENIPFEDQMLLLQFFNKYDIQSIKMALENYMISEIKESNVCRLANCSLISNALNLKEKCGEFLQKCFRENKLLNDFDDLNMEFSQEMLKKSFYKISI